MIKIMLDPTPYMIQKERIKALIDANEYYKYSDSVGLLAVACELHIVIVSLFIGQLYGFTDEILDKIKRDCFFYNIEGVIGLEESIALGTKNTLTV